MRSVSGNYHVLLPSLAVSCVLGIDYLTKFGIELDFASGISPKLCIFVISATEPDQDGVFCCGLELTLEQEGRLKEFLDTIPKSSENPGVTGLTEHQIDVEQNTPVKQRCYFVSPKVQETIRNEVDKMLEAGVIESSFSK